MITTINPTTGEIITDYALMEMRVIDPLLQELQKAQHTWREETFSNRAKKLLHVARLLSVQKNQLATLISTEMGKLIAAARAEIEKCQWVCEFYAENAQNYLSPELIESNYPKSEVIYQPLGIIFAIMPWNFPFWQVFRFAAPTLMAGNGAVLSHAPIVTGCALAIEKLFKEADIDVFRTVVVDHATARSIIEHPAVKAVTLTGSERAGKEVGAIAAGALKKVVLELGGSDPYLILEDADIEKAAETIVKSRMNNAGQVCIAAKRIIAVEAIYDALLARIMQKLEKYQMGDPLSESTIFGPLARRDLRDQVHKQVCDSVAKGALLRCGGMIPDHPGFYYPPTVLENVAPGMPAFDDEIFGPVIAMIKAANTETAITLANQTRFGLSAAIFTSNIAEGEAIARRIETGTCCINGLVTSDPRLPFGGVKASGYGRELSKEGIREFTNIKTICVAE